MHNEHDTKATLVLGSTGKSGRWVTAWRMQRRVLVRVGSCSGVPPCDWEDRATWAAARRDVGAVSVTSQPDVAVPGAVKTVRSYTGLAVQTGTRRLELLSGRGEEARQCAEHTATPGVWGTQR